MKVWNMGDPDVPDEAVYVGRPSKWGNPFQIGKDGTREEVIRKFRMYLKLPAHKHLQADARKELRGKDLVCWCAPKPCHGDVLMEIANEETHSESAEAKG